MHLLQVSLSGTPEISLTSHILQEEHSNILPGILSTLKKQKKLTGIYPRLCLFTPKQPKLSHSAPSHSSLFEPKLSHSAPSHSTAHSQCCPLDRAACFLLSFITGFLGCLK